MLIVRELVAGYGGAPVVRGVDLRLAPGEIVAVLGRNGSGRSTLAKALMGLLPWTGDVSWAGQDLRGRRTFEIARLGIGYVPENRDVFGALSVHDNLRMGLRPRAAAGAARNHWPLAELYAMFPALAARRNVAAGHLSGGEQQMLVLGRCLAGAPDLVIVDEPVEGLAPMLVQQVAASLVAMRRRGVAVLLIEQKLALALAVADRVLVMGQGRIVFDGLPQQLQADTAVVREWLQV